MFKSYLKAFYVTDKVLSGELPCMGRGLICNNFYFLTGSLDNMLNVRHLFFLPRRKGDFATT